MFRREDKPLTRLMLCEVLINIIVAFITLLFFLF